MRIACSREPEAANFSLYILHTGIILCCPETNRKYERRGRPPLLRGQGWSGSEGPDQDIDENLVS